MPNWNQVLDEINSINNDNKNNNPIDLVRRKYLKLLFEKTGRNIIAYYSGFLTLPQKIKSHIDDIDKNGFMATIHGLDRSKGLDLILHTPGGDLSATESLVNYLRKMFDKISELLYLK